MKKVAVLLCCIMLAGCSWEDVKKEGEQAAHHLWRQEGVLLDVPQVLQNPELPRGCEVTSLAMMLQFKGMQVSKMELAQQVKHDLSPYQIKNGEVWFGNPHVGFVGDMYSFDRPGLGVYHEPIMELANKYLPNAWEDITGSSFSEVEEKIANGNPVWVIVTSTFDAVGDDAWEVWNTAEGPIRVTRKEHAVVVTGYDEMHIYVNDPLGSKNEPIERQAFIRSWQQMGSQAITFY